jgi:glycosyltransferase involved in cell wall biosynthesis
MRIAILSRYQKTVSRGAESFVTELSGRLSKNHEVTVFSGGDSDNLEKVLKGKFDVVMPINGRMQSLKASLGRVLGKYKRSFTPYKLVIAGESGIGRDDIWNIAVAKPDVFVALTDYMADWAKKWAWGTKVVKIPNGVDLEKFKPNGEKYKIDLQGKIVLSVGALEWYKHHEKTIDAVSLLKDVSLWIVGSGIEKERLEKIAKRKMGSNFRISQVPFSEMPKIYRSAAVFTLPSWDREAFGIVYIEAMASGLPVVAPDDPPRREIVGQGGILVDINDPIKYAEAIQKALDTQWAEKPRKQAEKFSWEVVAKKYEEVMISLCKNLS